MGEYIPQAPVNDEAKKRNKNLPGMGGVFNYVNMHVYHYAGNNPIKLVDPDGRAAGDEFNTMDEAAIDFARTYNDDSIRHNREYGSSIYRKDNGKYVYTVPNVGDRTGVTPSKNSKYRSERVATVHTHTDGIDMYQHSDWDIDLAYSEGIVDYLVTPNGVVTKYDPAKDDGSYSGWRNIVEVIHFDAPNLKNYNNYPDDKINPRFPWDLPLIWFPYEPEYKK